MAELLGIAICRQASDYLKPGYRTGFLCKICGKALQVSPLTIDKVLEGSIIPLCNPCGFAVQKRLENAGASVDIVMTPEARRTLDEIAIQLTNLGSRN